jgi:FKBP-type peptidyl-prolyl cis-trans isomerase FkpA
MGLLGQQRWSTSLATRLVAGIMTGALVVCGVAMQSSEARKSADQQQVKGDKKLQIEDVKVGEGKEAVKGSTVAVNYTGTLEENGKKFDSSYDRNEPIRFKLGSRQVIEGWEQGIQGMKVGGKRILTIPPELGYGKNGYPPLIPQNAVLRFEVELVDVQ